MENDKINQETSLNDSALIREIKYAADFIHHHLPPEVNERGIKTKWIHIPSTSLSGDIFDYRWVNDEEFMFYIIDVSGHGIRPAILTASLFTLLRFQFLGLKEFGMPNEFVSQMQQYMQIFYGTPKFILKALNARYSIERQDNTYFTIWYGSYNKKTRVLKYAGAGHPPVLLFNEGKIERLSSNNLIVGINSEMSFNQSEIEIKTNTELLLFTDGAYEIQLSDKKHIGQKENEQDNNLWTFEEFEEYIRNNNSNNLTEELYSYLQKISGKRQLDDDFTMLKISID